MTTPEPVLLRDPVVGERFVGAGHPVYIVAELSANHNHDLDLALRTITAMKEAGADAVKLQTYRPDTITLDADQPFFKVQHGTVWDGRRLHDLYQEAHLPWEWHAALFDHARKLGMACFSSPFDATAVDFLEGFDPPAHKIASYEITDIPLIRKAASTGRPIILSTGIALLTDIETALATIREASDSPVLLLRCTSSYPAPLEEVHLRTIPTLEAAFGVPIGLSDHTMGVSVPLGAVALGAVMIEKHFILDRSLGGPDSSFSLEPDQFRQMVDAVRALEPALGLSRWTLTEKMKLNRDFSRSLFIGADLPAGHVLTEMDVKVVRPNIGLAPIELQKVLGKTLTADTPKGTPVTWGILK
jgi:pseudaminic acid synthase